MSIDQEIIDVPSNIPCVMADNNPIEHLYTCIYKERCHSQIPIGSGYVYCKKELELSAFNYHKYDVKPVIDFHGLDRRKK